MAFVDIVTNEHRTPGISVLRRVFSSGAAVKIMGTQECAWSIDTVTLSRWRYRRFKMRSRSFVKYGDIGVYHSIKSRCIHRKHQRLGTCFHFCLSGTRLLEFEYRYRYSFASEISILQDTFASCRDNEDYLLEYRYCDVFTGDVDAFGDVFSFLSVKGARMSECIDTITLSSKILILRDTFLFTFAEKKNSKENGLMFVLLNTVSPFESLNIRI